MIATGRPFKLISKSQFKERDITTISKMSPHLFYICTKDKYTGKSSSILIRNLKNILWKCGDGSIKQITKYYSTYVNNDIKRHRKPIAFEKQTTYVHNFHDLMRINQSEEEGIIQFKGAWRK